MPIEHAATIAQSAVADRAAVIAPR
jgi:hypothetical protein